MVRAAEYALLRGLKSWVWAGPVAVHLVIVMVVVSGAEPFADGVTALGVTALPIAAWLGVATLASDDAVHQSIVATVCGGRLRARVGQLLAALAVAVALDAVGLLAVTVAARGYSYPHWSKVPLEERLAVALVALVAIQLVGLAVAFAVAWPVFQRPAVSAVVAIVAALVLMPLPGLPGRVLLGALSHLDASVRFGALALGVAGALGLTALVGVGASVLVARRWRLSRD